MGWKGEVVDGMGGVVNGTEWEREREEAGRRGVSEGWGLHSGLLDSSKSAPEFGL